MTSAEIALMQIDLVQRKVLENSPLLRLKTIIKEWYIFLPSIYIGPNLRNFFRACNLRYGCVVK